jgi:plasmid stability protein
MLYRIATKLVLLWDSTMATSITLKNIPEPIYRRIKLAAKRHHRSLNSEIIACLEQVLAPQAIDVEAHLERARRLRESWSGPPLTIEDIEAAIDWGRE